MNNTSQGPKHTQNSPVAPNYPSNHPNALIVPWWMLVAAFTLIVAAVAGTLYFVGLAKQADLQSLRTDLLQHQTSHVSAADLAAYAACVSERLATLRSFSTRLAEWSKNQSQNQIILSMVSLENPPLFKAYLSSELNKTSHALTQIKNNAQPLHGAAVTQYARSLSEIQDFANHLSRNTQDCRPGAQHSRSSQAESGQ